jgi:hypothetical protein
MTYGQCTRAPVLDAAAERALARAQGSWGGYQAWHRLGTDQRLELVDCALRPANDLIDAYPPAL